MFQLVPFFIASYNLFNLIQVLIHDWIEGITSKSIIMKSEKLPLLLSFNCFLMLRITIWYLYNIFLLSFNYHVTYHNCFLVLWLVKLTQVGHEWYMQNSHSKKHVSTFVLAWVNSRSVLHMRILSDVTLLN